MAGLRHTYICKGAFRKGVADEELAKLEAERERKRELEDREDELLDASSRRQRSVSSHSVSTISTDASRDSRSPPPRRRITAQTPLAIAVIAEARHLRDDKGVQYHATAGPLRMRMLREVIEIDTGSPLLMLVEMTSRPLGNGMTRGQRDVMADGGVIQTRDQGRHSEMTGHIEGEMMTTNHVADAVVAVIKDKGGCLLERRPESEA
ncbi:hypothetical protein FP744_10007932 [Trichoderma asperellum]